MNDKLSVLEAETINDLVNSETENQRKQAIGNLSGNLDKLVTKKLIIKNKSSWDKRKQTIVMTDIGEALYINLLNDFQESLSILYDEVDDSYSIESIINNMDQFNWLLYKQRY